MAEPLRFERLTVGAMPGFEEAGFTLDGLSPGINIVHGPNASGKTTSARAIELLLWPRGGAAARARLSGRLRIGEVDWTVDLDGSRLSYQRGGASSDAPALPSADERDRYTLSLHELLSADNRRFAEAITRETTGGYDLSELAPPQGAEGQVGARRALQQAKDAWERAVHAQQDLREQELLLADLRARQTEAREAKLRVGLLEAAIEHATAREARAAAAEAVERFPAAIEGLRGDEHETIGKIGAKLEEIARRLAAAEADRDRARAAIAEARLPDDAGVALVEGVRGDLERLREMEREAERCEKERDAARAARDAARRLISGALDDGKLAAIDAVAMEEVVDFVQRARAVRAEVLANEAELRQLPEPEEAAGGPDAAVLGDGVRELNAWLRVPAGDADAGHRTHALIGAVALLTAGLLGATVTGWALVAAAAGAVLLALTLARTPATVGSRDLHRERYLRLDLPRPGTWTPDEVERLADELTRARGAAVAAEERRRRHGQERERLEHRRAELARSMERLSAERAELAGRLGVRPELDEQHLAWLADRISVWQRADAELTRADAAHRAAAAAADRLRAGLGERLAPYGYERLESSGGIAGALSELEKRRERRDGARNELDRADGLLRQLTAEREECLAERRAVLERLGLDEARIETLRAWCAELPAYREAADALRSAEIALSQAARRLERAGAAEDLFTAPEPELRRAAEEARSGAADFDRITDEITRIETRIGDAKKAHDVEAALQEMERRRDALREVRERETRAAIARVLLEHVHQETRDEHLPAVFHRAREIFSAITHGRYELRFTPDGGASFIAYDNEERRGRALDELSSGTRVQLLLAVRVAFVEMQEREARLPLVLDELLGNSDDERAFAIMDAVVELAKAGRQIFYLTAQADEVQKWRAALERHPELGSAVIDLAATRTMHRTLRIPELQLAEPGPRVPAPERDDHAAYGQRLGVPALDRVMAHAAGLHLWYLVEDPTELYRLLELGPTSWGALEGLVRNGGERLVGAGLFARASALARAAQTFLDASRVGLGRPVDRAALETADGITATTLDRVDAAARTLGGDARQLVAAIDARELPELKGFRSDKAEQFREYLEREGYLDPREPLGEDELRSRVVGSVAAEIESGTVSVADLDRLVARLRLGIG